MEIDGWGLVIYLSSNVCGGATLPVVLPVAVDEVADLLFVFGVEESVLNIVEQILHVYAIEKSWSCANIK